jgi:hypothetical protein
MVSKVLTNHLKYCLKVCIGGTIGVCRREIYPRYALIAIEIIHYLKCKSRGAKGELAVKIDISKPYNRVE